MNESSSAENAPESVSEKSRPAAPEERIVSIDALRGLALFGIFVVNMPLFGMSVMTANMYSPEASAIDNGVWGVTRALFELKFISIFSFLFGVGMAVQRERILGRSQPFAGLYFRRLVVLGAIGLTHASVVWYGDVLFHYAYCGILLLIFASLRPGPLFAIAGVLLLLSFLATAGLFGLMVLGVQSQTSPPPETTLEELRESFDASPFAATFTQLGSPPGGEYGLSDVEEWAYRDGTFAQAFQVRTATWLFMLIFFIFLYASRTLALFFVGAALVKVGFFELRRQSLWAKLALIGCGVGVTAEAIGIYGATGAEPYGTGRWYLGEMAHWTGSLFLATGYVGAALWLFSKPVGQAIARPFAAVGRMALTQYLTQSIVAAAVMYHWGFGQFGEWGRPAMVAFVVAVFVAQVLFSSFWLSRFRFGPAEWIWRALTYGRLPKLRRVASGATAGLVLLVGLGFSFTTSVAHADERLPGQTVESTPIESVPGLEVGFVPDPLPGRPGLTAYSYHDKNVRTPRLFLGPDVEGERLPPRRRGKTPRLLTFEFVNRTSGPLDFTLRSKLIQKRKKIALTVPPGETMRRSFTVAPPKSGKFSVEWIAPGERKGKSVDYQFPESDAAWRPLDELSALARELDREDDERRRARTRPIRVTVRDDLDFPVADAHILLLREDGLLVVEGDTDAEGAWSGTVAPGAYDAFVFATVPDRTDTSGNTSVQEAPRVLLVRTRLEENARELAVQPQKKIEVFTLDSENTPIVTSHVWVTPEPLRSAYRYQRVADALGSRARLDVVRDNPGGRFLLLTSAGFEGRVAARGTIDAQTHVLLATDVKPDSSERVELRFDPAQAGRAVIDPATGAGPAEWAWVSMTALDGVRERVEFATRDLATVYVPPGAYRTEIALRLETGEDVDILPYRLKTAAGKVTDLTIRAPFDLPIYWKRDAKRVSFWLAVIDASGRVLREAPAGGRLTGYVTGGSGKGETPIDRELRSLRFQYAEGFERIDLEKIDFRAEIPFGRDTITGKPHLENTRVYNVPGGSTDVPECLGDRAQELARAAAGTMEGSWQMLKLPEGGRNIFMNFVLFLAPGIGGEGGGGSITFETRAIHAFTGETDTLPGAYAHEFGHVLGFGHDPFGLLAAVAIDEPRFGTFGYRLLHAADLQRTFDYLEGNRREETAPWEPSAGVFAGLRLMFGDEIHRKMITERRRSESAMFTHGLSAIERMATLYSISQDVNVAWIFRAHGWPVRDERVELGWSAVRDAQKPQPRPTNTARLDGTPFDSWWTYGPVNAEGESTSGEESGWRFLRWPSSFVRFDLIAPYSTEEREFLFYRRFKLPAEVDAILVIQTDAALEVRLNGVPFTQYDASPPFDQPLHDETMLEGDRSYRMRLPAGDQTVEIAARQLPGTQGFRFRWVDFKGKPLRLALDDKGPDGRSASKRGSRLEFAPPLVNGSFELVTEGSDTPAELDGWLLGPVEPGADALSIAIDSDATKGSRSLRVSTDQRARGGVIQRILVEPGKKYKLSASIRTENFEGETFVSLFNNDVHTQFGKTEPITDSRPWGRYEAIYRSGITRVMYLACYVRSTRDGPTGTVWFDDIRLEVTK